MLLFIPMTIAHPQVHEMHIIRTAIMTPKSTFGTHILEHVEEMEFVNENALHAWKRPYC